MKGPKLLLWGLVGVVLLALAIALTQPAGPVRKDIGNDELRKLQGSGARIVDVRTPGEFALGHIAGAENVPVESVTGSAGSWNKDQPIVVYCATGQRSLNAAQFLAAQGFKTVYNLKAGIESWDGPVSKGDTPSPAAIKTDGKPILIDFYSDS